MKVTIKRNDAFYVFSLSVNFKDQTRLTNNILHSMLEEGIIGGDNGDCGLTIQQILDEAGYTGDQFMALVFPNLKNTEEAKNLLHSILIMHKNGDCPDCGCETSENRDGGYVYKDCTNCEWADHNEPDIDILPIRSSKLNF